MSTRLQRGMTLVEMLLAIVILSVGLVGVLAGYSVVVKDSADPLVRKQMLAIAEEMMEEISLKPFDPTGTAPVNGLKDCRSGLDVAPRTGFNDVADYNNYSTTGICDMDGNAITSLKDYGISVQVDSAAVLGALGGGAVRQITVTVSHGADSIQLVGWRTDFA